MADSQTITSRPWGNLPAYTDAEWHTTWGSLFDGTGDRGPFLNYGGDFAVSASGPAGMSVAVSTGAAFVGGLWCQNETARTLTIAANGGGAARYDLVFLHWTRATQQVQVRVVDGTAATCAAAAAPAANAIATYRAAGPPVTEWAVPLACVTVAPGATQIIAGNITDLRAFCRHRTSPESLPDGTTVTTDANLMLTLAADGVNVAHISTAIAGAGLTGGGGAALDIVPGTGLEIDTDALRIAAAAAGAGLTGGGGVALAVNPDGVTLELNVDQLRAKAGGVTHANLPTRQRPIWIGANEMRPTSASVLTWGTLAGLPVQAEGWVFPDGVNNYVNVHARVPANWVGTSQIYWTVAWAHVYAGVDTFSVVWYSTNTSRAQCAETLVGAGISQVIATGRVIAATGGLRLCETLSNMSWTGSVPGGYINATLGRNGATVQDDYLDDVVLLGAWLMIDEDM